MRARRCGERGRGGAKGSAIPGEGRLRRLLAPSAGSHHRALERETPASFQSCGAKPQLIRERGRLNRYLRRFLRRCSATAARWDRPGLMSAPLCRAPRAPGPCVRERLPDPALPPPAPSLRLERSSTKGRGFRPRGFGGRRRALLFRVALLRGLSLPGWFLDASRSSAARSRAFSLRRFFFLSSRAASASSGSAFAAALVARAAASSAAASRSNPSTLIVGIFFLVNFSMAASSALFSGLTNVTAKPSRPRAPSSRCGGRSPRPERECRS